MCLFCVLNLIFQILRQVLIRGMFRKKIINVFNNLKNQIGG